MLFLLRRAERKKSLKFFYVCLRVKFIFLFLEQKRSKILNVLQKLRGLYVGHQTRYGRMRLSRDFSCVLSQRRSERQIAAVNRGGDFVFCF